jgi:hypothetical protein
LRRTRRRWHIASIGAAVAAEPADLFDAGCEGGIAAVLVIDIRPATHRAVGIIGARRGAPSSDPVGADLGLVDHLGVGRLSRMVCWG